METVKYISLKLMGRENVARVGFRTGPRGRPATHTHTPGSAVSWAQSLVLRARGCRSHQANVVVCVGGCGPLEGATVIREVSC